MTIKVGDRVFYKVTSMYRVTKVTRHWDEAPDDARITLQSIRTGRSRRKWGWELNCGWTVQRVAKHLLLPQGA